VLRRRGLNAYGDAPPLFGWFLPSEFDDHVGAVFVHTPPYPVLLSELPPEAVSPLVELLGAAHGGLTGVGGPVEAAEVIAAAWEQRTGVGASWHDRQRLYRLATLTPPHPVPKGIAMRATEADRQLLIAWYQAFAEDTGQTQSANIDRLVDDRIDYGGLTLWRVDGEPVSMAGATRPSEGTVRIGPVYTPAHLRGRGYAGAATAVVSRQALDAGAREVLLFTNLANPTSNALYQRIGFREVEDRLVVHFRG
jgi:predicted GNAT family acetyltransferase